MSKVTFLGGGSFGISLAILLANKGNVVAVYDRANTVVEDININRRNDKFIKGNIRFHKDYIVIFKFRFF